MKPHPLTVLRRLVLFGALWLLLAGPRGETPAVAALAIIGATITSLFLWPSVRLHLRWTRLPALAGYFAIHSVRGGIDVARRVFSPALPTRPDLLPYETTLSREAARVLFVWMIGLMPGTASVNLESGNRLTVHVIDTTAHPADNLRALERRIAAVFVDN